MQLLFFQDEVTKFDVTYFSRHVRQEKGNPRVCYPVRDGGVVHKEHAPRGIASWTRHVGDRNELAVQRTGKLIGRRSAKTKNPVTTKTTTIRTENTWENRSVWCVSTLLTCMQRQAFFLTLWIMNPLFTFGLIFFFPL